MAAVKIDVMLKVKTCILSSSIFIELNSTFTAWDEKQMYLEKISFF